MHSLFNKFFVPKGRIHAGAYLGWGVVWLVAVFVAIFLSAAIVDNNEMLAYVVTGAFAIAFVWAMICLSVKRLHDADWSAWHVIWIFAVPFVGGFVGALVLPPLGGLIKIFVGTSVGVLLLCLKSDPEANRYGPPTIEKLKAAA